MEQKGLDLYQKTARASETPRETEARVLTQGALKLRHCIENWESAKKTKTLSEALRFNQRIWSIFQADLSSDDSPLPKDLRLNLLSLGSFVDRQIFAIMAEPEPDKLQSIIDVNLGLAAGLRKKQQTTEKPAGLPPLTHLAAKG